MSFMHEYVRYGDWWIIETKTYETHILPGDLVSGTDPDPESFADYLPSGAEVRSAELRRGWGGRQSAPRYLYGTDWDFFVSEAAARHHLEEMYEDGEEDEPT